VIGNGLDIFPIGADWLQARAQASPTALALRAAGRDYTFAQLDELVSRFCAYSRREGIRPGDHVGLLLPNSLAAVAAIYALARLGAVLAPLNSRLTPAELAWQVRRADVTHLLCAESLADAGQAACQNQAAIHTLPTDGDEFTRRMDGQLPARFIAPDERPELQAIVFTSGTTGFPKGAMITYANHFWSAAASAFKLGVRPEDRWLACLPLYHVGGQAILWRSCLYGTAVILHDGFHVPAVMDSLANDGVTLISLVPTTLQRLLDAGLSAANAPSLRLILLGGAAADPALLAAAAGVGLNVAVSYGLTEAASQVATMAPGGARAKPGSAGRPLLFTRVEIVDDAGRPLPANAPGEVVVSGPTVMAGYYRDPETTAAVLRDGRLHTGDVGYLDADGDLWLLDRRGDLIVSGGENVYPAEVERGLRAHPAVAAACVVGLPHAVWGRQVAAAIVLKEQATVTESELLAHCRRLLAGYKLPRQITFVDALPLTGSGKVQRAAVAQQLMERMETA
jgi:O-succinylbenzoic acid--CoA ligase